MFPITVTSLHSPGDTPCSKYPEGCINMTPFVVKPSDSLVAPDDHVGAIVEILIFFVVSKAAA
jgi:hypothetical protein